MMSLSQKNRSLLLGLIALSSPLCANAGNIDSTNKYAWNENTGWFNFLPTHGGGATVYDDHLEGYVWSENVGWIRLGGDTGSGTSDYYANTGSSDYGVNNDGSGNLSGYAWGENVGWINFNPTHSQVSINASTGDFDGYAWGENVGWIHFQNANPAYKVQQGATTLVSLSSFEVINENGQIIVQWQTAIEIDNAGFNVERRQSDGEWRKLNQSLILAKGDGHQYRFTDTSAQPGQSYQYRLVDVDTDDLSTYHYLANAQWLIRVEGPSNGAVLSRETVPSFAWESDASHQFKFQWAYSDGTEIYENPSDGWTLVTTLTPAAETWERFADWVQSKKVKVFWRVVAIDVAGNVSYSEVRHFEIGDAN